MPRIKSFAELARYLEQTGDDLELLLKFGALFWIPDADTGFGQKRRRPWVIITPYRSDKPTVTACPRTTDRRSQSGRNGLFTPGGVADELDQDGVFLLDIPRPFPAVDFRRYKYIGLLPEEWRRKLGAALDPRIRDVNTESSKP
jgi:mRNA-degrading endonuclease toxin of MazEF toxin-antitoxin module